MAWQRAFTGWEGSTFLAFLAVLLFLPESHRAAHAEARPIVVSRTFATAKSKRAGAVPHGQLDSNGTVVLVSPPACI